MQDDMIIKKLCRIEKEFSPAYLDISREELHQIVERLGGGSLSIVTVTDPEEPDYIRISKLLEEPSRERITEVRKQIAWKHKEIKEFCEDFARFKIMQAIVKQWG